MHKKTNDRIRHPAKVNYRTKTQRAPMEKDLIANIVTATKQARLKARKRLAAKLRAENAPSKMIVLQKTSARKMQSARIAPAGISPHPAKVGAGSAGNVRISAPDKTRGPTALSATSPHHRRQSKARAKTAAINHKPALSNRSNVARAMVVILDITATGTTSGKTSVVTASNMEWSARVVTTTGATARNSHQTARASHKKASAVWMHAHREDIRHLQEGQASKRCSIFSK